MPNGLADETSPYLLQHADNPVDWYPWGDEAFAEAKRRDVPIFLSVGYSACHWCHVMAHESFEDDTVAAVMNERFVNIKVDREERPDVDAIYMDAVTALTGHGGWPMSVFLDHDANPFYGGTYWPHPARQGMPGFVQVLDAITDAWTNRRDEVAGTANDIRTSLASRNEASPAAAIDPGLSDHVANVLVERAWDRTLGGFGRAPKFPQAMLITWLLDRHARTGDPDALEAATHALDTMARGGIHDQLAGGFHRYATDARWLIPHFEKMLYDNALLAPAYAAAFALTGEERYARTARKTCDYLLKQLRHPDGGFWSATDADTDGVEGLTFVWSLDEFTEVVTEAGADAATLARFWDVTEGGNFEGSSILHEPVDREVFAQRHDLDPVAFAADIELAGEALLARRSGRSQPGLDDKVLTSWNGLAVRGLARAGLLLDEPRYVDEALATLGFLDRELVIDGKLQHTWKDGTASIPAFLEDVAALALACLEVYAATGDVHWFARAQTLANEARHRFRDDDGGGFFQTAHDGEVLYRRPKDVWDNATPSGNSLMADVAFQLAAYTGERVWEELRDELLLLFQEQARTSVTGFGWYLQVAEAQAAGAREIAIVGTPGEVRDALARAVTRRPRPGTVLAVTAPDDELAQATVPLLLDRGMVDGIPAVYICEGFVCQRPITKLQELVATLDW